MSMSTVFISSNPRNASLTFCYDSTHTVYYGYSMTAAKKKFRQEHNLVGKRVEFIYMGQDMR